MRTFPAAKILIIILFVGSTQCTEEERVTSFEDRLASIKEMSKAASLALQESFSVVKIDKGYKIVFDQEAALARAKSSLKSAGFAEVNLPQIQPIDLSKALSKNSYGYVTKIEDRLMNTPSLKSVFPSAGRVKVTPQEVGQYFQSVAYEVETQALADPNLTENERLEIILCTSLVYEITPWFVTNYSSYFENGIPVDERTKGWLKTFSRLCSTQSLRWWVMLLITRYTE
jgi:hypothetical protein